jgi:hypothetical protein
MFQYMLKNFAQIQYILKLSLFEGSLPLPSHIPGLSMSSSSVQGYLSSLSKTGEIGEFSIQKEDFPALGKIGGLISLFIL